MHINKNNFLNLLPILILYLNCPFPLLAKEVLLWNNLQEFSESGWYSGDSDFPGVTFEKPSDKRKELQPLDADVTGGEVWTGSTRNPYNIRFYFRLNASSLPLQEKLDSGITNVNLTLKYYCKSSNLGIRVFPVARANRFATATGSTKVSKAVKWSVEDFPIDLKSFKALGIKIDSRSFLPRYQSAIALLDFVQLTFYKKGEENLIPTTTTKPPTTITATSSDPGRKTLVWENLQEFLGAGWIAPEANINGPSIAYNKPSDLNPSYFPLDGGITGKGVWSRNCDASLISFSWNGLKMLKRKGSILKEATLTLKYFCSTRANNVLLITPCQINGNSCTTKRNGRNVAVEWSTEEFPVDMSSAMEEDLMISQMQGGGACLLDSVKLSYEVEADKCSESWEYRAIDCYTYYTCVGYSYKEYYSCPKEDGLAFNPELGVCDNVENVEGCGDCLCEYRPDKENCKNYYFCEDSCKKETCQLRTCPGDLLWSMDFFGDGGNVQQCTLPKNAKCFN